MTEGSVDRALLRLLTYTNLEVPAATWLTMDLSIILECDMAGEVWSGWRGSLWRGMEAAKSRALTFERCAIALRSRDLDLRDLRPTTARSHCFWTSQILSAPWQGAGLSFGDGHAEGWQGDGHAELSTQRNQAVVYVSGKVYTLFSPFLRSIDPG